MNKSLCEATGGWYKLNCSPIPQVALWSNGEHSGLSCQWLQVQNSVELKHLFSFTLFYNHHVCLNIKNPSFIHLLIHLLPLDFFQLLQHQHHWKWANFIFSLYFQCQHPHHCLSVYIMPVEELAKAGILLVEGTDPLITLAAIFTQHTKGSQQGREWDLAIHLS